jgi:hypothetical protein
MKRTIASMLAILVLGATAYAQAPTPTYQWNFNMTNSTSATNFILPTTAEGVTGFPATARGVLGMYDVNNNPTNLLGLVGSGISGGLDPSFPFDRGASLNGSMGGNGPLIYTPAVANALTNLGVVTNFTITAWVKADEAISGFPRIFMLADQNVDAASGSFNSIGFLFYVGTGGNNLQLKVHNDGANGIFTSTSPLASGATNWIFVAVSYDSTLDAAATNNVVFYIGDRVNTLGSQANSVIPVTYGVGVGPSGAAATANSVFPAATNSPGYVNFSSDLNGDSLTPGVSNVWVSIGNRSNRQRSFHGRYDDVRFYANRVLSLGELESVRQSAHPFQPSPLSISQPPANTAVAEGQSAAFTVSHSDAPNPSYQWYRINPAGSVSNLIAGATNKDYVTPALTVASDNGARYAVRVHSTDPIADNGGAGIYSSYAVATVVSAGQYTVTPGMLRFEYFSGTAGQSVDDFLATPPSNYPSGPNLTLYPTSFDSRSAFPDDTHDNYFVRVSGSITPTVTTNYVFYIRGADQAQLYLSTDGGVSSNLICSDIQNGPQVFTGPESATSTAGGQFSTPQPLIAGTSYPVYALLKASAGPDFVQVAWKSDSGSQDLPTNDQNLADRLQPIPGAMLSTLALPSGSVGITSQPLPSAPSVPANSRVTFNIGVSANFSTNNVSTANGPIVVQWRKNGVNIPRAVGTKYITPYLSASDSGAQYSAVVSIPGASTNSAVATVTVSADNTNPTVVSATPDDSMRSVVVQFSEPVDSTALSPGNYSVPGLTVLGAAYAVDTNLVDSPAYDSIRLTTSRQSDNAAYTVTVSNVKDSSGNTISSGNSASFRSYGFLPGFSKFEYFENQTYNSILGLDVNAFVTSSPKFTNSDPDTIVYPASLEMSPDGTPTIRSSSGGNLNAFPPFYGTRMSALIVPPITTNYVFYIAANDSAILWLSTDDNPANKRVIAWQDVPAQKRTWNATVNASSATFATNLVGSSVTVPGATPWPTADGNGFAMITLQAGNRYYLEVDHIENSGFDSYNAVTWVTAADNATVTPPQNGSLPALAGTVIGWHFPMPRITSFVQSGGNVVIGWTDGLTSLNLGALGFPGLGNITPSYPSPTLQSATTVSGPYAPLTNASPAIVPATGPRQFFRIAE